MILAIIDILAEVNLYVKGLHLKAYCLRSSKVQLVNQNVRVIINFEMIKKQNLIHRPYTDHLISQTEFFRRWG